VRCERSNYKTAARPQMQMFEVVELTQYIFVADAQTPVPDVYRGIFGGAYCRDSPVQVITSLVTIQVLQSI